MNPLFEKVFQRIPTPAQEEAAPLQFLVSNLDEEEIQKQKYRVAVGRIFSGQLAVDKIVSVVLGQKQTNAMVKSIRTFTGVQRGEVKTAQFGDIVAVALQPPLDGRALPLEIGATLCDEGKINPWPYHPPDAPTFSLVIQEMQAAWKEKELLQGKKWKWTDVVQRLKREALTNTALKLTESKEKNEILMQGRGPLHLSVIIEDMRREGFEMEVRAPSVMTQVIDGEVCEPHEKLSMEFKEMYCASSLDERFYFHKTAVDVGWR